MDASSPPRLPAGRSGIRSRLDRGLTTMCDGFEGEIPASKIPVSLFRQILIWPLTLHLRADQDGPDGIVNAVTKAATRIARSPLWTPVDDPIEHIPAPRDATESERLQWQDGFYSQRRFFRRIADGVFF